MFAEYCATPFEVEHVRVVNAQGAETLYPVRLTDRSWFDVN
jgi:hypothetical protein